jgi:hypothetical protein
MCVVYAIPAFAQNEEDILRYSRYQIGGNARSAALAGATGAMGADASSLHTNAAGLALFRKSEFSLSLAFDAASSSTFYNGNREQASRSNLNFPNLSVVKVSQRQWKGKPVEQGVLSYTLGFSMHRSGGFYNSESFIGMNTQSSVVQSMAYQANGTPYNFLSDFTDYGMGWNALLIDTIGNNPSSYHSVLPAGQSARLRHVYEAEQEGRVQDYNFSGAVNVNDQWYIGAALTMTSIRYRRSAAFYEADSYDDINSASVPFDREMATYTRILLSDELRSDGFGVSGKLGVIYRVADFLRVGAAYHTPRYLSMNDYFSKDISVLYDDGTETNLTSGEGFYEYRIYTPGRSMLSVTGIIARRGLISVDIEQIDYRNGRLKANDFDFAQANQMANQLYRRATNIKAGAEYRIGHMYLRGGYALMASPYRSTVMSARDGNMKVMTTGAGYRKADYFFDFAVVHQRGKTFYTPYVMDASSVTPTAESGVYRTSFILTAGFKF